jgi:hypothetical protein
MGEIWRRLIADFAANLLMFLTPTHTHDFDNHNNGYCRSKTGLVQSVSRSPEKLLHRFETRKWFCNLVRFTIFKVVILLNQLGSLMICIHDLIVHTKIKEMISYYGLYAFGGKTLSTHIFIDLTQVSVPAENGSQQSATFTYALKRPALTCPHIPIADQHFGAHSSPTSYSNNQNLHK